MASIDELKHLQIPLYVISLATNGFATENLIGKGGFGQVYKGYSEKHGNVAVKRLDRVLGQGDREFKTEIALLSVYKHENISCLYGFCDEDGEKILVYKYESKGSLENYLHSKDLTWIQRIRICIDACNGLRYLHDDVGPQHRIIHRDVKSSNILLDENWRAKVSDFGLSKIGPANVGHTFLISNVCGTVGYIDPEYLNTAVLTKESDVYSFGVVLFEVLCGKPAYFQEEGQLLYMLAQKHFEAGTLDEIIHPDLRKDVNKTSLATFSTIAYQSLKKRRKERPTMNKVMEQLHKALEDQLAPSGSFDNFAPLLYGQFREMAVRGSRSEKVKMIFQKFDLNRDGGLNREEMAALVVGVNPRVKFNDQQISAIVNETFLMYAPFIDSKKGLSYDGLLRTYDDGAGSVDNDFEALWLEVKP